MDHVIGKESANKESKCDTRYFEPYQIKGRPTFCLKKIHFVASCQASHSKAISVVAGLLDQDTSPVIGLTQADPLPAYEVPSYQPVTAPFAPVQWGTSAVALPNTVTNVLDNQARAAYESVAC